MTTVEKNIKELSKFCNNLGKAFRKLTEDTDMKFTMMEKRIKTLEEKNRNLEDEIQNNNASIKTEVSDKFASLKPKFDTMKNDNLKEFSHINSDLKKKEESLQKLQQKYSTSTENIERVKSAIVATENDILNIKNEKKMNLV